MVKHNCLALNAGEMYPLLASMVSARLWESIESAKVEKGPPSSTEVNQTQYYIYTSYYSIVQQESLIRRYVIQYSPEITQLLGTVPRQLLLILKTNDLIRNVERSLGTRYPAAGFITMSKCCVRAIADDNTKHCNGVIGKARIKLKLYYQLFVLRLYELWHNLINTIAA